MQSVSNAFQEAARGLTREIAIRATLMTADATHELTAPDIAGGTTTASYAMMNDDFELGAVIASSCKITLDNQDKRWNGIDLEGATLVPYTGFVLPDGTTEYVPVGTFIVDDAGRPYHTLTLNAMDRLTLFDIPLANVPISYPTTNILMLQAICSYCLVPLHASALTMLNASHVITTAPEGDYSCRDIVGEIALMAAGFARMTRLGQLEIVKLAQPTSSNAYSMPKGSRKSFRQRGDPITITGLVYGDTIRGTDDYPLTIEDMGLQPSETALNIVWSEINGFTYVPYEANYLGNPAIDVGDAILHETMEDETILSIVTAHNYVFRGESTLIASGKSKSALGYRSANARRIASAVAKVGAEADKKLSAYALESAQLSDMVNAMLGTYPSTETRPDGSKVYYSHDKPTLAESTVIWRFDGGSLAISNDGGSTWSTGITADSNLVIKMISTIGLNAEWITTGTMDAGMIKIADNNLPDVLGQMNLNLDQYKDLTDDEIEELRNSNEELYRQIMDSKQGIMNLVVNSDFGNSQDPSTEWWIVNNNTTWGLVKRRYKTWAELKASGHTWGSLKGPYNW